MPLWVVDEKKQRVKEGKTKSFRSPTFKVVQNEPPCALMMSLDAALISFTNG